MPDSTPRVLVRAGPSLSSLSPLRVNDDALAISAPHFEGSVAVRLRGYRGPADGSGGAPEPKEGEELEEEGESWSIAFEGRFGGEGKEVGVDEILFGNVWQTPIRDYLPYGTSAALRFVKYVDPSLSCDLYADKPWALSPLFATLQRLSVRPSSSTDALPPFALKRGSFPEDVAPILPSSSSSSPPADAAARRSFFARAENRTSSKPLSKDLVVRGDFSHGFLDFSTLSLALPGGLKFSLAKYWNGAPVVFSCQRRAKDGQQAEVFFVVTFELVGEDGRTKGAVGAKEGEKEETKPVEEEEENGDVD
ncbi:hypothetical protein JCM10207_000202 [Rhodosporidiobolus poonsookiae]